MQRRLLSLAFAGVCTSHVATRRRASSGTTIPHAMPSPTPDSAQAGHDIHERMIQQHLQREAVEATTATADTKAPITPNRQKNSKKKGAKSDKRKKDTAGDASARKEEVPAHLAPRSMLSLPHAYTSFRNVTPLKDFIRTYGGVASGTQSTEVVRVGGRLVSIRDMGRIIFLTIHSGEDELQLVRQASETFTKADLKQLKESLRVGDIIGAEGHPGRTQKGELSVYATELRVLSPYVCRDQTVCPDMKGFLPTTDTDIKYRYRFVDMMANKNVRQRFRQRHAMVKALRRYLDDRDFVEVETPILNQVASGANAKPFVTHHNANNADLFLRVAPELYLKQCVVGGMDRVYEIGRVFRNEDADRSHNPEFTSCEFYAAYHTYEDLIPMTEDLLREMAKSANGHTKVHVKSCVDGQVVEVDLAQPFRRVSVYDEVQRVAGVELPPPSELHTPRGMAYMSAIMLRHNVPLPSVRTAAKMFDKLIDFFITDRVVEPTFVMDHPLFMSTLAREHTDRPGLSERFELFINGMEYCNAYTELNDPQEQFYRFQQQLLDKRTGDEEAMALDETFLKALQVGLPPTAGWGMGIDRVAMLLNGSSSIREEIIFPLLRTDTDSHDAKRRRKTASFFGFNQQMTLFCLNALEEEMLKRAAPQESCERVRQLRRCILTMEKEGAVDMNVLPRFEDMHVSKFRYEVTMAVLRVFCGSSKS